MKFPDLPATPGVADSDSVTFAYERVDPVAGFDETGVAEWLADVAQSRGRRIASLSYVFVTDEALHRINVEHLGHDTLTDIITFDLGDGMPREGDEERARTDGECYISLDRVRDNARAYGVAVALELRRVVVHGLLHLCGLPDKTAAEAATMRAAEDAALASYVP